MQLLSVAIQWLIVGLTVNGGRWLDVAATSGELFTEELLIKPLPSGHVYAQFCFSTSVHNPSDPLSFYR